MSSLFDEVLKAKRKQEKLVLIDVCRKQQNNSTKSKIDSELQGQSIVFYQATVMSVEEREEFVNYANTLAEELDSLEDVEVCVEIELVKNLDGNYIVLDGCECELIPALKYAPENIKGTLAFTGSIIFKLA